MFHFRIAEALGNSLTVEVCPHCGKYHFDKDWFAAKPHKVHLCEHYGKKFRAKTFNVSNPAVLLRLVFFADMHNSAVSQVPNRRFVVDTAKYDSYELWGTCTGALWTMKRPEDNGLHLHCYRNGKRVIDETFGEVVVDGVTINNTMAQLILPQRQVKDIAKWLGVTTCHRCNTPAFHKTIKPQTRTTCQSCGYSWNHRKITSNPILELM